MGDESRAYRLWKSLVLDWWQVWVALGATRLGVLLIGFLSQYAASGRDLAHLPFARSGTFIHYADVLANGYTVTNATEFPVLPGLMWAMGNIGISAPLAALLIVNVAFAIGLLGMAHLGARYVGKEAATRGAIYLAIFPTAHYFSIASSESLMLLGMVGAALFALRATTLGWVLAGCAGAMCALTRPPGGLVGIILLGIAIAQLADGRLRGRRIAVALAAGAAIPAAVVAFFLYLGSRTGDRLAAIHAQKDFDRSLTLDGPFRAIISAIDSVRSGVFGEGFELLAVVAIVAALAAFLVSAAGNRWEVRGWALFGCASLLMPLATGIVWQMPRFALLIPPLFWMLGVAGRRQWLHLSALILLPMALAFKVVFEVVGVVQQ